MQYIITKIIRTTYKGIITWPHRVWSLRKPVERDRWLFGHNGFGMIIFAFLVAAIAPLVVWGFACLRYGSKNVPNILLGNYDLDNNHITGSKPPIQRKVG